MKKVELNELSDYSARYGKQLSMDSGSKVEETYRGLPINIETTENGVIFTAENFEQKFLKDEISSIFDTGRTLVLVTESGKLLTFSEAGEKGIKTLPASQAPKDPADRAKKRAMYLAQGYSGVHYEGEEEPDEDEDKEGQDLVDSTTPNVVDNSANTAAIFLSKALNSRRPVQAELKGNFLVLNFNEADQIVVQVIGLADNS